MGFLTQISISLLLQQYFVHQIICPIFKITFLLDMHTWSHFDIRMSFMLIYVHKLYVDIYMRFVIK